MVKDDYDLENPEDSSEDGQVEHDKHPEEAEQDDTDEIKDLQDAFAVCLFTENQIRLKMYGLNKNEIFFHPY